MSVVAPVQLQPRAAAQQVVIDNLIKQYGSLRALNGVSFAVNGGEWVALMGPSGSGKTTLINILGGLDTLSSGRVIVDGVDLAKLSENDLVRYRAEKVGFVFQQFHLVPYLTALENVMLAQYFHSVTDEKEAEEALKRTAARGHCASINQPAEAHSCRRTYRQSRRSQRTNRHRNLPQAAPCGSHHLDGHARPGHRAASRPPH